MGMYPNDSPQQYDYNIYDIGSENYLSDSQKLSKGNSQFEVNKVDQFSDFLLHIDKENCPRYGLVQEFCKNSKEFIKI